MARMYAVCVVFCTLFVILAPVAADPYTLTLEQAITTALEKNPDLRVVRLEEESARAGREKARLPVVSNPVLETNLAKKDRPAEEGGGTFTNFGFKLSQELEIAGQRGIRITVSEKELARVRSEIRDRERLLIAEVKDGFAKALSLKKRSAVAREVVDLNEELLGYTKVKFQAGDVSALEVNLAEVELSKARKELLLAQREYKDSLYSLQSLLGASFAATEIEGELPTDIPALTDKASLYALAVSNRPDSKAAAFEVEKTESALNLVTRQVFPTITVSGFYDKDERKNVIGLGVSVPLPIFDRKRAEKKEALAKAEGAKIKAEGLRGTIERELDQALNEVLSAGEELSLYKKEILVRAEENLNLLNLAFKEGKIGFLEVRVAQKDTIETQFAYIEAQARMQRALNAIEKTTGGALK